MKKCAQHSRERQRGGGGWGWGGGGGGQRKWNLFFYAQRGGGQSLISRKWFLWTLSNMKEDGGGWGGGGVHRKGRRRWWLGQRSRHNNCPDSELRSCVKVEVDVLGSRP